MSKIIYFPIYKLIHETKTYYYFYSYGNLNIQHEQTKKYLEKRYNKSAFLLNLSSSFPGKKVNEWVNSINKKDREKYRIIQIKK